MVKIKKNRSLVPFLIIVAALFFLHIIGVLRPVENFLAFVMKPVAGRFYNAGVGLKASYQADNSIEDLAAEVDRLRREVSSLTVANSHNIEIEEENRKLRETLNFAAKQNFQIIVAGVIAKETASDASGLIINRGAQDGLVPGLAVVSDEGFIVGKVLEVKDMTAKICLTTNINCQLAAAVQNSDHTQGITDGDLGLTVRMSFIPQSENISLGDTVITSGLGEYIARGLVIGKISQIHGESNEVWQEATIEPLADLDNLTIVSVIIP